MCNGTGNLSFFYAKFNFTIFILTFNNLNNLPISCKYIQSLLGQVWFFIKWLQYFVVPSDAFKVLPSIKMLLTAWIARNASSDLRYVTYALALGPWHGYWYQIFLSKKRKYSSLPVIVTQHTVYYGLSQLYEFFQIFRNSLVSSGSPDLLSEVKVQQQKPSFSAPLVHWPSASYSQLFSVSLPDLSVSFQPEKSPLTTSPISLNVSSPLFSPSPPMSEVWSPQDSPCRVFYKLDIDHCPLFAVCSNKTDISTKMLIEDYHKMSLVSYLISTCARIKVYVVKFKELHTKRTFWSFIST